VENDDDDDDNNSNCAHAKYKDLAKHLAMVKVIRKRTVFR
jgi:hypothetical protein